MTAYFVLKSFADLSLDELYSLLRLRQQVFVVEQHCPFVDCDNMDQASWHLQYRTDNGHLHAYCRLLPVDIAYEGYASIGRVISSIEYRKRGLGIQLMQQALSHCKELFGDTPLQIGAQLYLKEFYERFGFVAVGDVYIEDDIEHILMQLHQSSTSSKPS